MASPLRLLREAALTRYHLVMFALLTAALNGIVTASVGTWLAQSYASHHARRASVQTIADLIYERRARGGMVVSTLRRKADVDELRQRKRAYDEVFVEWNRRIQNNVLQIRDVIGAREASGFERQLQDLLVPVLTVMDNCLTRAYDIRLSGADPLPTIEGCHYAVLHQFTLDCAKAYTDELYRRTRLSLMPFSGPSQREMEEASRHVEEACARPTLPPPTPPSPAAQPAAPTPATSNGDQSK